MAGKRSELLVGPCKCKPLITTGCLACKQSAFIPNSATVSAVSGNEADFAAFHVSGSANF